MPNVVFVAACPAEATMPPALAAVAEEGARPGLISRQSLERLRVEAAG